jgi:hypothetical protein
MAEVAHVLFPGDAPKPTEVPEYFKARQSAAEMRLLGSQKPAASGQQSDDTGKDGEAEPDAATLFPTEKQGFDESVVTDLLDNRVLSAVADGDKERAEELKAATSALTENFKTAGTDSKELRSAFDVVRERSDFLTPPTAEQITAEFNSSMDTLKSELGGTFDSDLRAARAFIRDLETVSPGVVHTLEHGGGGNDLRLIRAAIKEAKLRGYR